MDVRSSRFQGAVIDGAVALAVLVYGTIWLSAGDIDASPVDWLVLGSSCALLLYRRPFPVSVVLILVATRIARAADGHGDAFLTMALFVALYSVAERRRPGIVAAVSIGAAVALLATVDGPSWNLDIAVAGSTLGFFGAAVAAGHAVATQRRLAESVESEARQRIEAASAAAEAAAAQERAGLSADLHDRLAHHINVSVVLAESGRFVLADPDAARDTFEQIADSGRASLAELDRLLEILSNDRSDDATVTPVPMLEDLEELLGRVSGGGIDITARLSADPSRVSTAASSTMYRVAQEGLTNVIKHAPTKAATVETTGDERLIVMTVTSPPRAAAAISTKGTGRGLTGLAERLRLIGGHLDVSDTERGFIVRATAPNASTEP